MKHYPLVSVKWTDAHAVTETWTQIDDLDDESCLVLSVGYLLPESKPGHIVLIQSIIEDSEEVDGVLAIPLGMVQEVRLFTSPEQIVDPQDSYFKKLVGGD